VTNRGGEEKEGWDDEEDEGPVFSVGQKKEWVGRWRSRGREGMEEVSEVKLRGTEGLGVVTLASFVLSQCD